MLSLVRRFKTLSVFVALIGAMGILSSCASKQKDYTTKTNPFPYNVVAINVTSLDPAGDEFARQLEFNLNQSVGGPAFAEARNVNLIVQTHPNGMLDKSTKSLFRQITSYGGTSVTATIRLMDSEDGSSLKYEQITSSSTKDDINIANLFIAEDMIAQIRAILGLTMYPPRPISNIEISTDGFQRDETVDVELVLKPKQAMSDPLLNGQITPETKSADLMKQIKETDEKMSSEAMEMKKTVNTESKMVRDVLMENMIAPTEKPVMDKDMTSENQKEKTMLEDAVTEAEDIISESDLCIVTVENDCLGPNISE